MKYKVYTFDKLGNPTVTEKNAKTMKGASVRKGYCLVADGKGTFRRYIDQKLVMHPNVEDRIWRNGKLCYLLTTLNRYQEVHETDEFTLSKAKKQEEKSEVKPKYYDWTPSYMLDTIKQKSAPSKYTEIGKALTREYAKKSLHDHLLDSVKFAIKDLPPKPTTAFMDEIYALPNSTPKKTLKVFVEPVIPRVVETHGNTVRISGADSARDTEDNTCLTGTVDFRLLTKKDTT